MALVLNYSTYAHHCIGGSQANNKNRVVVNRLTLISNLNTLIMSTIIVAVILLAFIAIFILLLAANERKKNRRTLNELLLSFSQSAIKYNLSISGQEVINESMIGLDAVHRKLLVVYKNKDNVYDDLVIDLSEVTHCSVESVSKIIDHGNSKSKLDQLLEKIVLRFLFNSGNVAYDFPFYTYSNSVYELPGLQQKARQWQTYINPLLKPARTMSSR